MTVRESIAYSRDEWYVQVWNGRRWTKVRGPEGGPWESFSRARTTRHVLPRSSDPPSAILASPAQSGAKAKG